MYSSNLGKLHPKINNRSVLRIRAKCTRLVTNAPGFIGGGGGASDADAPGCIWVQVGCIYARFLSTQLLPLVGPLTHRQPTLRQTERGRRSRSLQWIHAAFRYAQTRGDLVKVGNRQPYHTQCLTVRYGSTGCNTIGTSTGLILVLNIEERNRTNYVLPFPSIP